MIFITVFRAINLFEADRVRLLLSSIGIKAWIPDESAAMTQWSDFLGHAPGIRVQVLEEDSKAAADLLRENGYMRDQGT